jgi:hypothetical protein
MAASNEVKTFMYCETQGCACPKCLNECGVSSSSTYDGPVFCRRCYRSGCTWKVSKHKGHNCTSRECTHDDHL